MSYTISTFNAATPVQMGVASPSITGNAQVGQLLTCNRGLWINSGPITYQWLRDGVNIAGATNATYTLVAGDQAKSVKCRVKSAATFGQWDASTTVDSNATAAVAP